MRKIKKINQEKIGGDLIFNLSSVCYLEKDQKVRFLNKTLDLVEFRSWSDLDLSLWSVQPQAYLGEEDQLRPSSPLVRLGKLWSPSLSQYLIRTVHGYLRSWSDQLYKLWYSSVLVNFGLNQPLRITSYDVLIWPWVNRFELSLILSWTLVDWLEPSWTCIVWAEPSLNGSDLRC